VTIRLVLLASTGYQSLVTLQTLLQQGCTPTAIALAGGSRQPVTTSLGGIALHTAPANDSLEALAQRHQIPLLDGQPEALLHQLSARPPSLLLASCYPHRLPDALLALPAHGSFNLHPSALPLYRGPSPIFWQLRDGVRRAWISVHRISAQLDAGELLLQHSQAIADGSDYMQRVRSVTQSGITRLLQWLPDWLDGRIGLTPQQGPGSYQGWPRRDDFIIEPRWSLRHSYNFIRGSAALGRARLQLASGELVEVERVLHYDAGLDSGIETDVETKNGTPTRQQRHGNRLLLQRADARLHLAIRPEHP